MGAFTVDHLRFWLRTSRPGLWFPTVWLYLLPTQRTGQEQAVEARLMQLGQQVGREVLGPLNLVGRGGQPGLAWLPREAW